MSEEDKELHDAASLGASAEQFFMTEIGQMLVTKAREAEEQAKANFMTLDPYIYTNLSGLQNTITRIQHVANLSGAVIDYLENAITEGENAESVLNELEPEN